MDAVASDLHAVRDGDGVEAGALTALVAAALPRAWRRDSALHGEAHWRCVATTGHALADRSRPGRPVVVFCFGLLHDTRRENETYDPDTATACRRSRTSCEPRVPWRSTSRRFASLVEALRLHSDGQVSADPTIGTCWDADRLHLPRVSIDPDPTLLSTPAALGAGPLSAAAALREHGAPDWDALVAPRSAGLTGGAGAAFGRSSPSQIWHEHGTNTSRVSRHRGVMDDATATTGSRRRTRIGRRWPRPSETRPAGSPSRSDAQRRGRRSPSSSARSRRPAVSSGARALRPPLRGGDAPLPHQGARDGGDPGSEGRWYAMSSASTSASSRR